MKNSKFRLKTLKIYLLLLLFIALAVPAIADESIKLTEGNNYISIPDTSVLDKYRNNRDFQYTKQGKPNNFWQDLRQYLWSKLNRFFPKQNSKVWLDRFLVVGILLLLGVILWLFNRYDSGALFSREKRLAKEKAEFLQFKGADDELVHLMRKAMENESLKEALHYNIIFILRLFEKHQLIQWKKSKTNTEYAKDLANTVHYDTFVILNDAFELAWYGEKTIERQQYDAAIAAASSIYQNLEKSGK
jgi:hypothetical protein